MRAKLGSQGLLARGGLLLLLALASGCHLGQPASASFASVVITGKSSAEIRATAASVFAGDGYIATFSTDDAMVFEKEGTRANKIAHGGWIEETGVRERVRAKIIFLAPGQYRLQCQAYMVRHADDPFLQDEVRLKNIRARPYQKLLNEVAAQ